ncbi:hypothetical protein C5Y96_17125, partial [Blastopirellula marina]
ADSDLVRQQEMTPIVVGNHLIVRQVGALSIDCIDIATGRLLWSHFAPDMERSVGLAEGKFVYLNRRQAVALDVESGEVAWRNADDWQIYSASIAGPYLIEVAGEGRRNGNSKEIVPWIRWLSLESGQWIAGAPLTKLTDKDPQLGKLLVHPQGTFVSHRNEARDLDVRLHRLAVDGEPLPLGEYRQVPGAKEIYPTFAAAWAGQFPGWRFATAETSGGQTVVDQEGK